MNFYKINSQGNDFCIFGNPDNKSSPEKDFISLMCNRRYGIGCDCAVFIGYSKTCDYFMHVYNPDGFEAEICGNALRCSAKYVYEKGFFNKNAFYVETKSGSKTVTVTEENIITEIGKPNIIKKDILRLSGTLIPYTFVSLGNPHCVIFVNSLSDNEFHYLGKAIENHTDFPEGTNVEFANVESSTEISIRIWERGIGETLSCSTGSCACVAAAAEFCDIQNICNVKQPGGIIRIVQNENGSMYTHGNCNLVFKGELFN